MGRHSEHDSAYIYFDNSFEHQGVWAKWNLFWHGTSRKKKQGPELKRSHSCSSLEKVVWNLNSLHAVLFTGFHKFSLEGIPYSQWLCSLQLPHWPGRLSQQLMSVSNIVIVVQNEGGVHLYETLDSSNPSSLWLIPSAPVFKKWFITGEPASLSPAPTLLRGAITVRSAELGLPASDQTPVCFYRCSTALWERPQARSRRVGRSKLRRHDGWKVGLGLNTLRRCPPDNYASVPAEPMTLCTPQHHPISASCCWGAAGRSLACVFATPLTEAVNCNSQEGSTWRCQSQAWR